MFTSGIRTVYRSLVDNRARRNAERELAALDNFLLKDIGISRAEIHSVVHGMSPRR